MVTKMMINYKNFFKLKLKENFQYRGALFFQLIFGFIPLIGYLTLWHAIYSGRDSVGGLTETQMVAYYLISRTITVCVTPSFQWEMNQDIREGDIVKFLTKPISYLYYRLSTHLADVLTKLSLTLVSVLVLLSLLSQYVFTTNGTQILLFFLFLSGSIILAFLLFYLMMLFSFFITEIASLSYTVDMITQFLSGALLPLSIFPEGLKRMIDFTPFPYITYFPVRVFLTSLPRQDYINALISIILWAGILTCLIKLLWNTGLKRFAGNGI